ncbi:hypothetical protein ACFHW2_12195 [Actinomadura sp. LOL_016]|uniref:hypothetical protein n=1 Tax=unclassified Actinomadura TaxID=2626254 RepID=UPI003A808E4B
MTTLTDTETARIRTDLARHLNWHPDGDGCLTCRAAKLVATLPAPEGHSRRLEDIADTAQQAGAQIDEAISHLTGGDGLRVRAALDQAAVSSPALQSVLDKAEAVAQLGDARARLGRVADVHAQLATELRSARHWSPTRQLLVRVVRLLARAWHGDEPHDPREPLTH